MAELSLCCNSLTTRVRPPPVQHSRSSPRIPRGGLHQRRGIRAAFAAKPGGFSLNSVLLDLLICISSLHDDFCFSWVSQLSVLHFSIQKSSHKSPLLLFEDEPTIISMRIVCYINMKCTAETVHYSTL